MNTNLKNRVGLILGVTGQDGSYLAEFLLEKGYIVRVCFTKSPIAMAKRNNVNMALTIAREARQIHGGMGITGEYPIMRHMMNLESVVTYEVTHDIHLLITGMDITGFNAFS